MLNGGLRRDFFLTLRFFLLFYFASRWLAEANSVRRVTKQMKKFSMQIQGYSPSQNDDYVAISYKAEPGYIVKFEPFASADRVHHMLLYGCDTPAMNTGFWRGSQTCSGVTHILYAWARNAPPLELPERVAFPVGNEGDPVQHYVLQIHYAHPFEGNVRDFSGLTVHLSDKRPEFIADVYLFVSSYGIPPHQPAFFNNVSCTYESDVELHPFAFRTHTHAMGRVVSSFFKHDGQWRKIGKRNPQWPQLFEPIRDKSLVIRKGDFMAATCRFDSSDKDVMVPMGSMGVDEMCNFYMMYYRRATDPDPFPYGGACTYNENPELVNREYPKEGTTLLPSHPEWEHMAHQTMKPFGVAERARLSHVGDIKLGQVSGLAFDNRGRVVIFHRHTTTWSFMTFNSDNTLSDRTPIQAPTILVGEYVDGALKLVSKYGASMFYMPHSIFVDEDNYYYTTDVGTHQVVKWEIVNDELRPVWELGEKFVPGSDIHHFCKPAGVAVSRADGSVYVADGYCNNRVMKFTKDGHFLAEWGRSSYGGESGLQRKGREFSGGGGANFSLGYFNLPHDITLDERHQRVFVADRENGRVQAFNEQGDPLFDVQNPTFYRTVYSAHYSDGHGLVFIPGSLSSNTPSVNTELNAYVVPPNATQIEYAFRPTTVPGFQRPHILRMHDDAVWVGEIDEVGGVLWRLDIRGRGETPTDASIASLYGESGVLDGGSIMKNLFHTSVLSGTHSDDFTRHNRTSNAEGESVFWSTLFLAALCITGFYLLCYYCVCRQRCWDCMASVFCCCCNHWSSLRLSSAAAGREGAAAQKFLDRKGFRPLRNLDDDDDGDEESDEEFQISPRSALKR